MRPEIVQELLSLVKGGYDDIAADFDMTRKKELWPEIREFAADVRPGETVLDVGCGNGRLLEALPAGVLYLGVDNSVALLKAARDNYPENKFLAGDILKLDDLAKPGNPASSRGFDHVFCLAVLPHIPSRELQLKALEQLAARLSPRGRLVISLWNLWASLKHRRLLFKAYLSKILGTSRYGARDLVFPWRGTSGKGASARYYHAFTDWEFRRLARAAGLKIISSRPDRHNYWYILEKIK